MSFCFIAYTRVPVPEQYPFTGPSDNYPQSREIYSENEQRRERSTHVEPQCSPPCLSDEGNGDAPIPLRLLPLTRSKMLAKVATELVQQLLAAVASGAITDESHQVEVPGMTPISIKSLIEYGRAELTLSQEELRERNIKEGGAHVPREKLLKKIHR
jgi:hypothetical protein